MTDLATSITRFITHLQGVQIGGADVFASSSVWLTTDPPGSPTNRYPRAVIRATTETTGPNLGELEFVRFEVEITINTMAGEHGQGAVIGKHGKSGLAEIRSAVIAATKMLDKSSTPAIGAYIRFISPGESPTSRDSTKHSCSLIYEGLLEI